MQNCIAPVPSSFFETEIPRLLRHVEIGMVFARLYRQSMKTKKGVSLNEQDK